MCVCDGCPHVDRCMVCDGVCIMYTSMHISAIYVVRDALPTVKEDCKRLGTAFVQSSCRIDDTVHVWVCTCVSVCTCVWVCVCSMYMCIRVTRCARSSDSVCEFE